MQFVSVHGGHSGQFCHHAKDRLEEIVLKYIEYGYAWVGITEHAPGIRQKFLYPDEQEAGFTPASMEATFADYMVECRRLQKIYKSDITIYAAFEIETYSGYEEFVPRLMEKYKPDYIVGSLHFVDDLGFDYSKAQYIKSAKLLGGLDAMYCRYFDQQYRMLQELKPAVVGHFDLIRIFDEDYKTRLKQKDIWQRIERNLAFIRNENLIMDYNVRSLKKGADEPYISEPILDLCLEMKIAVVPGDDSHGVADIHQHTEKAIQILKSKGFDIDWPRPALCTI